MNNNTYNTSNTILIHQHELYARNRLLKQLTNSDQHITWICSPAGSGKTALVYSWIIEENLNHTWYHLDAGIDDTKVFLHYLINIVNLDLIIPQDIDKPHVIRQFFSQLFRQLTPGHVLVFDNYNQDLPASFHKIFCLLLEALPANQRVIVLSRHTPPGEFARLNIYGFLQHIRWQDIRFTLDESQALLRMYGDITEKVVQEIHNKTNGWAAGMLLMRKNSKSEKKRELFDYFAYEVFYQIKSDTQHFLLYTCFLPKLNEALVSAITGLASPGKILRFLHEHHCFIEQCDTNHYIYHPLFAEFLQIRAKNRLPSNEFEQLQLNTAKLLTQHHYFQPAINLLLQQSCAIDLIDLLLTLPCSCHIVLPVDSEWQHYWHLKQNPTIILNITEWARYNSPIKWVFWAESVIRIVKSGQYIFLDEWLELLKPDTQSIFPSAQIHAHVAYAMASALIYRQPHQKLVEYWITHATQLIQQHIPNYEIEFNTHVNIYYSWRGTAIPTGEYPDHVFIAPHIFECCQKYSHYLLAWQMWQRNISCAIFEAKLALQQAEDSGYIFAISACQLLIKLIEQHQNSINDNINLSPPLRILSELTAIPEKFELPQKIQYIKKHLLAQQWICPTRLSELCAAALEHDIETEYIIQLIQQRQLTPPIPIKSWPYPIKIHVDKQQLYIYQHGQLVKTSNHPPQKALDLLKLIIKYGCNNIDIWLLVDELWQTEGDKAYYSFKFTLHRLRQLLGNKSSIYINKGRLTLNWKVCQITENIT